MTNKYGGDKSTVIVLKAYSLFFRKKKNKDSIFSQVHDFYIQSAELNLSSAIKKIKIYVRCEPSSKLNRINN